MLNYFMAGIDKFFSNFGDSLKPVVFNLCIGEDYDLQKDTKIKRIEKHTVKCLKMERNEQNSDNLGAKKKEITIIARVKDFRRVPEISDFFELDSRKYNILEIINDNGLYISIRGQ